MAYVENLETFLRVFERGSMSAAGRDMNKSAALVSSRILELEKHFSVRLFNRTTRNLVPTSHGKLLYPGAFKILDTIAEVEGGIAEITDKPKGSIFISAPLGLGKLLIAPLIPKFNELYPEIKVRLRLSDRRIEISDEGLDVAFLLGAQPDSEMKIKPIDELQRVLCAAPTYIEKHGLPESGDELVSDQHNCLPLRYPGAGEFFWMLQNDGTPQRYNVRSEMESDDGDVLTAWALAGCGIINKPVFEISHLLEEKQLIPVAHKSPPTPLPFACIYPHKRLQDIKTRLFIDYAVNACKSNLRVKEK